MRTIERAIPRGEVPDVAPGAKATAPRLVGVVHPGVPSGKCAFVRQELWRKEGGGGGGGGKAGGYTLPRPPQRPPRP